MTKTTTTTATATIPRVPKAHALPKTPIRAARHMGEYEVLAQELGLMPLPDLTLDTFQRFLENSGIAVYDLDKVRAYMDAKVKAEGKEGGWRWHPLREKDKMMGVSFGKAGKADSFRWRHDGWNTYKDRIKGKAASDYYASPNRVYDKAIPLHALRKVKRIEAESPVGVSFMVCDYVPKPTPKQPRPLPDPFLMVCVKGAEFKGNAGRFVVDFWDEPGFGLDKQLGI